MWGLALADFGRDPCDSKSLRGNVFSKKMQKLLTKFPGLATSGLHYSAMTTDRRKFTAKWSLYRRSLKLGRHSGPQLKQIAVRQAALIFVRKNYRYEIILLLT